MIGHRMRLKMMRYGQLLLFLVAVYGVRAHAQDWHSLDWNLTQLRGTWQAHSFYDKWTLEFDCDHKMIFDREPADYAIVADTLRVQDSEGSTDYLYTIKDDRLTLNFPDGSERTYRRTASGSVERLLKGNYRASAGSSSSLTSISFDGDGVFLLHSKSSGEKLSENGIYRAEGDVVVLTFDDTTSYEGQIRLRDQDGTVLSVMFDNEQFQLREATASGPVAQSPAVSIPSAGGLLPSYDPGPPPETGFVSNYGSLPASRTSSPPAAAPSKPAEKPVTKPRDFGTTRGKPGGP
jgi:hypothetical protein